MGISSRSVGNAIKKVKDADIIAYIKDKEFSTYVKKLIREDMKK